MTQGSYIPPPPDVEAGVYVAWGLNFNHDSTINGTVYTKSTTARCGDPMFIMAKDAAIQWVAQWTYGLHDANNFGTADFGPMAVKVLDDGGMVCAANMHTMKNATPEMEVEIRHADGTIFKTFAFTESLDEDKIGVGVNGTSNNSVIARYDVDGTCLWAKRFGVNDNTYSGWSSAPLADGDSIRIDTSRNRVCMNVVHRTEGALGQDFIAGIGEANELTQVLVTSHSSFDLEWALDTGNLQPRQVWDSRDTGTAGSIWGYATSGLLGGTGPLLREGYCLTGTASNASWDDLGPTPLINAMPFVSTFKYAHYFTKHDDASAGPDWTVYATETGGDRVNVPSGRSHVVTSLTELFASTFMDTVMSNPFLLDSPETTLSVSQAVATSSQVGNSVLWKLNLDGLTGFDFGVIHKLDATGAGTGVGPVMLDSGILVCTSMMPSPTPTNFSLRLGVGEAGQEDFTNTLSGGVGELISFFNESDLEFQSAMQNNSSCNKLPDGADATRASALSATELITNVTVIDSVATTLDLAGSAVVATTPTGSQHGYFGYAIWNTSTQGFDSWSGEVVGISNATNPFNAFTQAVAFDGRRFT